MSDCPLSLPHRSCGKPKIQRAFCSPEIWHRLLLKAEGKSVVCQTYGELRKAIQTQSEAFVATCGQLWKQSRPSIHWIFCSVWPVPSLLLSSATTRQGTTTWVQHTLTDSLTGLHSPTPDITTKPQKIVHSQQAQENTSLHSDVFHIMRKLPNLDKHARTKSSRNTSHMQQQE